MNTSNQKEMLETCKAPKAPLETRKAPKPLLETRRAPRNLKIRAYSPWPGLGTRV